jgi:hypothetical protein
MRWRERVLNVDDAPRSHLSRPAHAGWCAEDAALRDLVKSLLLSIFEGERLVGTPAGVSLELFIVLPRGRTLPSAQSII